MTVQDVPTYADPSWTQTTTLEGSTFQLTFTYNQRCNCMYLSVADLEGNDIYDGVKIICNSLLLRKCADKDNAPAGEFWCLDTSGTNVPPGLGELGPGARCILCYITSDLLP
jgi:hypothetical protein